MWEHTSSLTRVPTSGRGLSQVSLSCDSTQELLRWLTLATECVGKLIVGAKFREALEVPDKVLGRCAESYCREGQIQRSTSPT